MDQGYLFQAHSCRIRSGRSSELRRTTPPHLFDEIPIGAAADCATVALTLAEAWEEEMDADELLDFV